MTMKRLAPHFNQRIAAVAAHDIFMAMAAFEFSIWIRHISLDNPQPFFHLWPGTLIFVSAAAAIFWAMGLYRGIWHYASTADITAIMRAVTLTILVFLPALFVLNRLENFPRTAVLILWLTLVILLSGPRLLYRYFKDGNLANVFARPVDRAIPVLLVGSGDLADSFIRQVTRARETVYQVAGIIDHKRRRIGRDLRGVRILGHIDDLEKVVADLDQRHRRPQRIILADDKIDGPMVERLLDGAERLGLSLARVPQLTDFRRDGGDAENDPVKVRPIDVEDLLGRPQKMLDRDAMARMVAGRRVLVTGAGGTIGSELTRQIAALHPAKLILIDNGEHALYLIDLELHETWPDVPRVPLLADVRDAERIETVIGEYRPELIFHAAAFKHVPMVEINPGEGVRTNVGGTMQIAEAAVRHDVATMVLISTDKAVNPTSVMGASKRLAEMICQGLSLSGAATRFVTVRFGNVLGSTGSVVPLFQRQLARGGPLTVTHPDITRYFMTTREAVQLVLQAAALSPDPEEAGKIFVLDMGQPVRIQELARQMIRLAGFRPDKDIEIVYTGLRPGEKLYEEVLHEAEAATPTAVAGLHRAAPRVLDYASLKPKLAVILAGGPVDALRQQLQDAVPEFKSPPTLSPPTIE